MSRISDAALDELRARNPIDTVAGRWVALRRSGRRLVGPCPICSLDPQSRRATRFECDGEKWLCAVCQDAGDVIKLVMLVEGVDFRGAVERLGGVEVAYPQAQRRREEERTKKRAERERQASEFRERERRRLWGLWKRGRPVPGSAVEAYLALRGVAAPPGACLRCLDDVPYFHGEEDDPARPGQRRLRLLHRGPAMLAAVIGPDGRFAAMHFTWLDVRQPKGKAMIADPETGEVLPAKKVRGSKAGGRIELVRCPAPRRIVIGEGIEKVLAVWVALRRSGRDLSDTAFWTSIDLGNLGGKHLSTVAHPTLLTPGGRPQRVPGPEPDLSAPAIPVADSVEDIVLLGDSTSDRFLTEMTLRRAAGRYGRPGRTVRAAWAPEGVDFDEVVRVA